MPRAPTRVPGSESGPLWLTTDEAIKLVTEAEFQRTVIGLLRAHGWRVFHDKVAWRSDPGWPDLYACNAGQKRAIHVEIKKQQGKVSAAQVAWLDALRAAGQEAYLIRPSQWHEMVRIATERCDGLQDEFRAVARAQITQQEGGG